MLCCLEERDSNREGDKHRGMAETRVCACVHSCVHYLCRYRCCLAMPQERVSEGGGKSESVGESQSDGVREVLRDTRVRATETKRARV